MTVTAMLHRQRYRVIEIYTNKTTRGAPLNAGLVAAVAREATSEGGGGSGNRAVGTIPPARACPSSSCLTFSTRTPSVGDINGESETEVTVTSKQHTERIEV